MSKATVEKKAAHFSDNKRYEVEVEAAAAAVAVAARRRTTVLRQKTTSRSDSPTGDGPGGELSTFC